MDVPAFHGLVDLPSDWSPVASSWSFWRDFGNFMMQLIQLPPIHHQAVNIWWLSAGQRKKIQSICFQTEFLSDDHRSHKATILSDAPQKMLSLHMTFQTLRITPYIVGDANQSAFKRSYSASWWLKSAAVSIVRNLVQICFGKFFAINCEQPAT